MMETPQTIGQWAAETFGLESTIRTMAARVNVEVAELHLEMVKENKHRITMEAADVYITLCHMARCLQKYKPGEDIFGRVVSHRLSSDNAIGCATELCRAADESAERTINAMYGMFSMLNKVAETFQFNLQIAVINKMKINRSREWRVENGVGQHV